MAEFELAQAMMALKRQEATGVLEVCADERRTLVQWASGKPTFAEENAVSETLGRLLVRQRRMTSDQYKQAIDKMTDRLTAAEDVRFGQVIVELGFLDADQVRAALADQVRWRVVHAMLWENPSWSFQEGKRTADNAAVTDSPRGSVPAPALREPFDVEPLIVLATRWVEPERLDAFLAPYRDDAPSRTQQDIGSFGFDDEETAFVGTLDGKRSIVTVLDETYELRARAILTALLLTEACSLETLTPLAPPTAVGAREPPAKPAMLARIATTKIRAVRPPPGPSPRTPPRPGAPAKKPSTMLPHLTPGSKDARLSAEQSFQTGRSHLRRGDIVSALRHFLLAVELWDGSSEYKLYAEWAEWLRGEETNEKAAVILETARKAIIQDPNLGFPRYVMGRLALRKGDKEGAERLLRFAAKLDPTLSGAVRLAQEAASVNKPAGPDAVSVVVSPVVVVSEPPPPATSRGPEQALLELASQQLALEPEVPSEVLSVPESALVSPSVEKPPPLPKTAGAPDRAPESEEAMTVPSSALTTVPPPANAVAEPAKASARPPPLPPPSKPSRAETAAPAPAVPVTTPARSRVPLVLGVVVLLGCLGAAAFVLRQRALEEADATRTTTTAMATSTESAARVTTSPTASAATASAAPVLVEAGPAPVQSASIAASASAAATAAEASAPVASARPVAPVASVASVTPAAATPDAGGSTSGLAPGMGELVISDEGAHRVWVDGKLMGDSPLKIQTTCGHHELQVGSAGKLHTVDVPCGHAP